MTINSFLSQQTCREAPCPSPSPWWSSGQYSLPYWLYDMDPGTPGLCVFWRSPHTPVRHPPLVSRIPGCHLLFWQKLFCFSGRLHSCPPPFLLPYSLIPFLCHYLYRKDQQFPNNGIKSAKLLKSFIEY